jgi:hypothetical protein
MFLRWCEYTQRMVRHKKIIALVHERSAWRAARRAFKALRTSVVFLKSILDIAGK